MMKVQKTATNCWLLIDQARHKILLLGLHMVDHWLTIAGTSAVSSSGIALSLFAAIFRCCARPQSDVQAAAYRTQVYVECEFLIQKLEHAIPNGINLITTIFRRIIAEYKILYLSESVPVVR